MNRNLSDYDRSDEIMSVLATPNKNSYIVKKENAKKIISSKNSHRDNAIIKERAEKFALNNLKMQSVK